MAVAELNKAQRWPGLLFRGAGGARDMRDHLAANNGEYDRRAEPGGVADELAPGHPVGISLRTHLVTTTVPVMNGWIEQM